ncbi:MAG: hypothetical protein IJP31_08520 [Lachnospiraceae bacterium]|nr:hypothetical protein [Lachnospiraceae bacterium]
MKRFERYCTDIREIDGIKTYIVSQKYLNDILSDLELLALVGQSMPLMEIRKIMQY